MKKEKVCNYNEVNKIERHRNRRIGKQKKNYTIFERHTYTHNTYFRSMESALYTGSKSLTT